MEIKPYASFHTMWEIYADLKELAALGDDDADTAVPYAVHKVMGQSNAMNMLLMRSHRIEGHTNRKAPIWKHKGGLK